MIPMNYQDRLLKAIPAGAHTYSRGFDQYPQNAPQILRKGKGAYVFDDKDEKYLDYGMALRAVHLGYAREEIDQAAIEQIHMGNNLTRASLTELEAAETLIDLIPSVDMVKFTKNGSTATTAAIKLSRAYTGRELIARCGDHPFFSYDDWFIASTLMNKGTLPRDREGTKLFKYNDIASLEELFRQNPGKIACVILEPATTEEPKDNYLQKVKELCKREGAVFVLDEMITGFRWHLQGAQTLYKVEPDLCTFGKAMANGFSVAAIAGKREIMQLGSIEKAGQERFFLLSTTHGAEMCGLGAFIATMKFMKEHDVIGHLKSYGEKLVKMMNDTAAELGVGHSFKAGGIACSPYYLTVGADGKPHFGLRTLFAQEMIKHKVLMPWIALSYAHGDKELELTQKALRHALGVYQQALEQGYDKFLVGHEIKPVFRTHN